MTFNRKQLEDQLAKTFDEIRKLHEMAQEAKIEKPEGDDMDEHELVCMSYNIASATFSEYMKYEYTEIERQAEWLQKQWLRVDG